MIEHDIVIVRFNYSKHELSLPVRLAVVGFDRLNLRRFGSVV